LPPLTILQKSITPGAWNSILAKRADHEPVRKERYAKDQAGKTDDIKRLNFQSVPEEKKQPRVGTLEPRREKTRLGGSEEEKLSR